MAIVSCLILPQKHYSVTDLTDVDPCSEDVPGINVSATSGKIFLMEKLPNCSLDKYFSYVKVSLVSL